MPARQLPRGARHSEMAPTRPRAALQFFALLRKNFTLQTRSRKTVLGIGGWGALLVQIVLPGDWQQQHDSWVTPPLLMGAVM